MEWFLGWIAFSVVAGIIASAKNRTGVGYFFLSLILSPLIGIILAAALPRLPGTAETKAETGRTACPFCKKLIIAGAIKCKHCGSSLEGTPANQRACPSCKKFADIKAPYCPACGHNMGP